jgi:hypothetical protein
MPKSLLPALAALVVLSGAVATSPAAATTEAAIPVLGSVGAAAASVRLATMMCGSNGCGQVQTKRVQRRKFQTMGHG